jgi:hypothetical protein
MKEYPNRYEAKAWISIWKSKSVLPIFPQPKEKNLHIPARKYKLRRETPNHLQRSIKFITIRKAV